MIILKKQIAGKCTVPTAVSYVVVLFAEDTEVSLTGLITGLSGTSGKPYPTFLLVTCIYAFAFCGTRM